MKALDDILEFFLSIIFYFYPKITCEIIGTFIYSLFANDMGRGKNGIFCVLFVVVLFFLFFLLSALWNFISIKKTKKREERVFESSKKLTRKQRKQRRKR